MATIRIEVSTADMADCLRNIELSKTKTQDPQLTNTLDQANRIISWLKGAVDRYDAILQSKRNRQTNVKNEIAKIENEKNIPKPIVLDGELKQFVDLFDKWPVAVDPSYICNKHLRQDRLDRASQLLDLIIPEGVKNKRFLDFGCGTGEVAAVAKKEGATTAVGYDIVASEGVTNNLDVVRNGGPYDIAFVYDVLDHAQNPVEALKNLASVITPNTTVYCRCHPFCSIHGGHLYTTLNKAYIHLILTDKEIVKLGYLPEAMTKVFYPRKTYSQWFSEAGFKIVKEQTKKETVPDIVNEPIIQDRIMKAFGATKFPGKQLAMSFVDYIIQKV